MQPPPLQLPFAEAWAGWAYLGWSNLLSQASGRSRKPSQDIYWYVPLSHCITARPVAILADEQRSEPGFSPAEDISGGCCDVADAVKSGILGKLVGQGTP